MTSLPTSKPGIRIALAGDLCLGDEFVTEAAGRGRDVLFPFREILPVLSSCDIGLLNLEGPVERSEHPRADVTTRLANDRSVWRFLEQARTSVVCLANNHIMDFGTQSLTATRDMLAEHGMHGIGAGLNLDEARRTAILERGGTRVAFLAFTTDREEVRSILATPSTAGCAPLGDREDVLSRVAAARDRADIVCVSIHWGREFFRYPAPEQVALARDLADAGAQLVVGHHPHVLQGFETYRDSLLLYSLGNFFFPPVRTIHGRRQIQHRAETEFMVVLCDIAPGATPRIEIVGGQRRGDGRLSIYRGGQRKRFAARIRTLAAPLARPDYTSFWEDYRVRRENELVREHVVDALRKLCRLSPAQALATIRPRDIIRNLRRIHALGAGTRGGRTPRRHGSA